MKKFPAIVLFCFLLLNLWAFGSKEKVDYSVESFTRQITKQLDRDIFDYEKNIIEATYLYYTMKYDKVWDSEKWTQAKQTPYGFVLMMLQLLPLRQAYSARNLFRLLL